MPIQPTGVGHSYLFLCGISSAAAFSSGFGYLSNIFEAYVFRFREHRRYGFMSALGDVVR